MQEKMETYTPVLRVVSPCNRALWLSLLPGASQWEGGHEEQRAGHAMAPHPGSHSQTSQVLPSPQEANTGSPLKLLQAELVRNLLQHQPSAGLRKPHFSPKLTSTRAEQGSCLPRLHGEGKYPWNLLFTQRQIRELTP